MFRHSDDSSLLIHTIRTRLTDLLNLFQSVQSSYRVAQKNSQTILGFLPLLLAEFHHDPCLNLLRIWRRFSLIASFRFILIFICSSKTIDLPVLACKWQNWL